VIGFGLVFHASNDHILYHQQDLGCTNDNHIISLDINTGEISWTYPAILVRAITSYENNYIIAECCTDILLLNNWGQLVWESQALPVRIYRPHLSVVNSSLYFPAITSVYSLSMSDGRVTETIDMSDVAYIWDDVAMVNVSDRSLGLVNLQTHQTEWTTEVFDQQGSSNFKVYRFEDVIVVAWGTSNLIAYELQSGEKLWEISEDFSAIPVVIEGNAFIYSVDNRLTVYSVMDGTEVGYFTINRTRASSGVSSLAEDAPIQIGGTAHNIYVYYPTTSELLLLDFELRDAP
jgi:outer membrane protein assembly factor BamB